MLHGSALFVCVSLLNLAGCSAIGSRAAVSAATDPWTWVPLVGAAAVNVTDSDQRISDWAKTRTPLYGSRDAAQLASDRFRAAASTSAWATLVTARPSNSGNWFAGKGIDAAEGVTGLMIARNTTGFLKAAAQRERPHDGPVHDSFPSAHSTDAFAHATVGRYHADRLPIAKPAREGAKWAMSAFAGATAWGRVEGGVHYPTDVLVGAAVANFSTLLLLGSFDAADAHGWRILPVADGNVLKIELQKQF